MELVDPKTNHGGMNFITVYFGVCGIRAALILIGLTPISL